jgi:hypothetical protein
MYEAVVDQQDLAACCFPWTRDALILATFVCWYSTVCDPAEFSPCLCLGRYIQGCKITSLPADVFANQRALVTLWVEMCCWCHARIYRDLRKKNRVAPSFENNNKTCTVCIDACYLCLLVQHSLWSHLACAVAGRCSSTSSQHYLQTCLQTSPPWTHCELRCVWDISTHNCSFHIIHR